MMVKGGAVAGGEEIHLRKDPSTPPKMLMRPWDPRERWCKQQASLFVHQTCNFHWSSGMVPSVDFPGVPYGGKGPHHWNQTRIVYYEVNLQLFSKYSSLSL